MEPSNSVKRFTALAITLAFIAVSGLASAEPIVGRVVGVADGDTLTVLDALKHQHKIRLSGIDAPEGGQAFVDALDQAGVVERTHGMVPCWGLEGTGLCVRRRLSAVYFFMGQVLMPSSV